MKGGKKTYILIFINYKIKGSDTTVKLITLEPENSVGFSNTVFGSQCYRFQHPTLFSGPSVTDSNIQHCFPVPVLPIPTSDTVFRSQCYQFRHPTLFSGPIVINYTQSVVTSFGMLNVFIRLNYILDFISCDFMTNSSTFYIAVKFKKKKKKMYM